MTDLEIAWLCAEALGKPPKEPLAIWEGEGTYNPMHDDAQCFELVKKFRIELNSLDDNNWYARIPPDREYSYADNANKAVCLCVVKMELAAHPNNYESRKA